MKESIEYPYTCTATKNGQVLKGVDISHLAELLGFNKSSLNQAFNENRTCKGWVINK